MSYIGTTVPIPLGGLGLQTDDPMTSLPPNALIKANNISLFSGRISKSKGSSKFNTQTLTDSVVGVYDWWPTPSLQRLIAVTADGSIWRDTGDGSFNSATPIETGLGPYSTDVKMVTGGQESAGNNRKLFILGDSEQIQVINGDGGSTSDIANPSTDWATGNYPTFGIIYQGRLCVFGSSADPHRAYFSTPDDHEDFTTGSPPTFAVFPGEGEGLVSAAVYRGLLFLFKRPFGVYIIDGRDPLTTNWTTVRYSDSFGVASPHAVLQVLGDLIAGNSFGSYTSLQASDAFGDFEAGDVLANASIENYIRTQFNQIGLPYAQSIYYPEKKLAFFSGYSTSISGPDRMLVIDMSKQQPRFSLETKDIPTSLGLRKDTFGILRPMYGTADGDILIMDQDNYLVNGTPYLAEFQTAYTDFSFASSELGGKNKIFDFLELNYVPTGNNNFSVDVFIDGELRDTLTFSQTYGTPLDSFVLDSDVLAGDPAGSRNRKPLKSCTGNRISVRVYNGAYNEGFTVERILVGFRLSDERVYAAQV